MTDFAGIYSLVLSWGGGGCVFALWHRSSLNAQAAHEFSEWGVGQGKGCPEICAGNLARSPVQGRGRTLSPHFPISVSLSPASQTRGWDPPHEPISGGPFHFKVHLSVDLLASMLSRCGAAFGKISQVCEKYLVFLRKPDI